MKRINVLSQAEQSEIDARLGMPRTRLGCGAAILDGQRLVLVKRKRDPEAGCWGLPGGKVESGERIEVAVSREIKEELGIEISLERLICITDNVDVATADRWIAPVLAATLLSGRLEVCEPDALSDVRWFELSDLPSPLTAATRQTLHALKSD